MRKSYIAIIHDLFMAMISLPLALFLRLGVDMPHYAGGYLLQATALFTICAGVTFFAFGNHRRTWRFVAMKDVLHIARSVIVALLVFLLLMFIYNRLGGLPRSTPAIHLMLLLALLITPRVIYRSLMENNMPRARFVPWSQQIPVLLVGINNTSELFLRETVNNHQSLYRIVALLCQDGSRTGQIVHGIKVLGGTGDTHKILSRLRRKHDMPRKILIAPDLLDGHNVSSILDISRENGLTLERLPRLTDFTQAVTATHMRPLAIEDLLGRSQNMLDRQVMQQLIEGRRLLVTGAGGTIGSELCRQIANFSPEKLILLEQNEYALYQIDQELQAQWPHVRREIVLGDIRQANQVRKLLQQEKPLIVFHAAAHKHVPLVEDNPAEAILTNLLGTQIIADCCAAAGISQLVLISTDKAVNPTSIMGATKLLAELYVQSVAKANGCIRTIVRFGNVLGSTGSVIPLFQKQLTEGGPITVTHPEMTRYFMTVRESVQLVLLAASVDREEEQSGKRGAYVLDMGNPLRIKDLAEQMIRLSGLEPGKDVHIVYSGVRAGEKLHEELFYREEAPMPIKHKGLLRATGVPPYSQAEILTFMEKLKASAMDGDNSEVRRLLHDNLPRMMMRD